MRGRECPVPKYLFSEFPSKLQFSHHRVAILDVFIKTFMEKIRLKIENHTAK